MYGRTHMTKIDNVCSVEHVVKHGVPQGSILGPLLFLIFINGLNTSVELCGTSMYADDTAVFYFAKDVDEMALSIQYDMQSISYWMRQNRLSLNVSKTKFMLIGSKQKVNRVGTVGVSLNGEAIENVHNFKYLGVLLDQQLQFHTHIDHIVNKVTNKLGLLYKTRSLFDEKTALMLYKAMITPHLDYGCLLYEVAPEYQLRRLQVIQNAAARLILLAQPDTPVYQLHEKLHLDTLATRRSKTMVKTTYSCLHDKEPHYLYDKLKAVSHEGRRTRACDSGMLQVPRMKTNYGKMSYAFRGPVQWNVTNLDFKAAVNKKQLKSLLKSSWYKINSG